MLASPALRQLVVEENSDVEHPPAVASILEVQQRPAVIADQDVTSRCGANGASRSFNRRNIAGKRALAGIVRPFTIQMRVERIKHRPWRLLGCLDRLLDLGGDRLAVASDLLGRR